MRKQMHGPLREGKRCGKCDTWKPAGEFYRSSTTKDGLQYRCKACMDEGKREYYKRYYDEVARERRRAKAVLALQQMAAARAVHAGGTSAQRVPQVLQCATRPT